MYHCLIGQGKLKRNDRLLILGAGGLGIHGVQIARIVGAKPAATSRNAERLRMAEHYGATGINPKTDSLTDFSKDFTEREGFDVIADCVGTVESIKQSLEVVRPGGKVLVIAYISDEFRVPSIDFFMREKELIGCRGSTKNDLSVVTDLVSKGEIEPVIGETFPLSKINEAAECLSEGRVLGRIVLERN
jgi:propanol-preferring alcohol dehydrogenase